MSRFMMFALTYFIGIFGFPLIAGWLIVEVGTGALLGLVIAMATGGATVEATMAAIRSRGVA